jgi:hypothetical protein
MWKMHAKKSFRFFGGKIHDEKNVECFFGGKDLVGGKYPILT